MRPFLVFVVWGFAMRTIDIHFAAKPNLDARGSIVVVIDILRATSTIVTALGNGCRAILPVANLNEAVSAAARMKDVLLAGERQAKKPAHFDLGNSPLEFSSDVVQGKTIILSTTNGTKALRSIQNADEILMASFLNFDAVTLYLGKSEKNVIFYCAGNDGAFSLEDTLCAALLTHHLSTGRRDVHLSDAAQWNLRALRSLIPIPDVIREEEILSIVSQSEHARKLKKLQLDEDISYCCQLNRNRLIPFLDNSGSIIAKKF